MDPQTITEIKQVTEELLTKLSLTPEVVVEVDESAVVQVNIVSGEGSPETDETSEPSARGILIGRHGETLHALQLLLGLMINRKRDSWVQITVDVDGYRKRREEQLVALANRIAEKVQYLKEPIALNPMPASDRRIIHMALVDTEGVVSESTGSGRQRKIVVSPA